jgi:predicted transcriptional regulator
LGKDITQDSEIHGKLINGNSYLIVDKTKNFAVHLYKGMVVSGYDGLFFTRDTSEKIQNYFQSLENNQIFVLSQEKVGGFENVSKLDELIFCVDKFIKNKSQPIILLDRIDYLLTNFSFEAFIKSLYKINNLVTQGDAVFLLRLNPSFINPSQLALLREELKQLPSQDIKDVVLQDYIYDILEYVDEQTQKNLLVTYKKVSSNFDISKVTTAKRLNIIKEKGLILIRKQGKTKTIHITEKGSALLHRSKMA